MKRVIVALVALSLLAVGVMAFGVQHSRENARMHSVTIGGETVFVTVAQTQEERQRGLSGRPGLAADEGMLFVFPKDGVYSFWMKDMLFSIDIIWISGDSSVVHIEKDVSPASYPRTYSSEGPARFVLELPAGFTDAHNVRIGAPVGL